MDPYRRRPSGELHSSDRPLSEGRIRVSPRSPASSGQFPFRFTRVREILLRYLSPILVDSVLNKALQARKASPGSLSSEDLVEITSDIMVGLRLFVAEQQLPRLMLELAEILEIDYL